MGHASEEKKHCTVEEYFELETSDIRHEYYNGEIFAMVAVR